MTKFMKQISVVNFSQGKFLHDKLYNTLIEVLPVRAYADLDGNVTYYFKNNEKEFSIAGKDMVLYKTRESYENGDAPVETHTFEVEKRLHWKDSKRYVLGIIQDDQEHLRMSSFSLVDGVPTQVDTPLVGFTINENMWFAPMFKSGVNMEHFYCAPERVLWFNEYKYTNEQGEEVTQEGTRSYALLTAEQKKVIEKFHKALDALTDAKIAPAYDCEHGKWYFLPAETTELEWESAGDEAFLITDVPEDQSFSHGVCDFYERPTVYKRQPKQ